jgi:predicted flap endonuclease-1-like 5' DNA nuclease
MATSKGTSRSKKAVEEVEEVEVVEAPTAEAVAVNEELKAERDATVAAPAGDDEPSESDLAIVEALEKDPGLVGRLKDLLGIGDTTEVVDDMGTTLTLADVASQHPTNITLVQNYTRESAAKEFGLDAKEVIGYNVRGGVPDESGQVREDDIYLVVATRDAVKHAKKISV